jgi:hypothetical protein
MGLNRSFFWLALLLIAVVLLIWSPWISAHKAGNRVVAAFNAAWDGVIDGCGFECNGCGVKGTRKGVIGYAVSIEYACGLIPEDSPEYHITDVVFVTPLGTVHGLEGP